MARNPFQYGQPVPTPGAFYGRQSELGHIVSRLRDQDMASTSVIGERRIGKTSLLQHLAHPEAKSRLGFGDNYILAYLGFEGFGDLTASKFWQVILDEIQASCDIDWLRAKIEQILTSGEPEFLAIKRLFRELKKQNIQVVLLLDEFEYLVKNENLNPTFFSALRHIAITYNLAIVTASKRTLIYHAELEQVSSPFFNIFSNVTLQPFDLGVVTPFISNYLHNTGISFNDRDRELVQLLSGGFPFFLQMACHFMFEAHPKWPDDENKRRLFVRDAFSRQATPHFEHCWRDSSAEERKALIYFARQATAGRESTTPEVSEGSKFVLKPVEQALIERGLLVKSGEQFQPFSFAFADWLGYQGERAIHIAEKIPTKLTEGDTQATTYELGRAFFEAADFDVELAADNLFWAKNDSLEWQETGRMPVYCFEEGQPVTAREITRLASEVTGDKRGAYAFVIFHERLVDGAVRQLWEFRQRGGPIVIPFHATEIRQILLEPSSIPSPAYWKLVALKRQWSVLTDPYASVNSLTNPQWFFGRQRQAIIQEILSEITSGVDRLAVFGMRRVGKTTLLNHLALACQERRYPVAKILCRPLSAQYTYADVLSEIIQEWGAALEALHPGFAMPSPSLMVERYSPKTASKFKADVFELVEAVQHRSNQAVRFVLILDEVDHIFPNQESPEEAYHQYCSLTQTLKSVIEAPSQAGVFSMVAAMEYPWIHLIDRFPHNKRFQNPLYGRFRLKPVELLQREELDDMVQTIGELAGLEYTAESLDVLYHNSSGHPEITRKLCSCLIELRDSDEISSPITAADIYLALGYFLEHPLDYAYYLETTFWKDPLSTDLDTEQKLMQELAREGTPSENALLSELLDRYKEFIRIRTGSPASDEEVGAEKKRFTDALRRLIELQIVTEDKQHGTCAIRIPIYRDWIRQEILAMEVEYA
jgi:hypothetical protein